MKRIPRWMLTMQVNVAERIQTGSGVGYGDDVAVRCRIEPRNETVYTSVGSEVVSLAVLFLEPEVSIHTGDRVMWGSDQYSVISVAHMPGPSGAIHHLEVQLGRFA